MMLLPRKISKSCVHLIGLLLCHFSISNSFAPISTQLNSSESIIRLSVNSSQSDESLKGYGSTNGQLNSLHKVQKSIPVNRVNSLTNEASKSDRKFNTQIGSKKIEEEEEAEEKLVSEEFKSVSVTEPSYRQKLEPNQQRRNKVNRYRNGNRQAVKWRKLNDGRCEYEKGPWQECQTNGVQQRTLRLKNRTSLNAGSTNDTLGQISPKIDECEPIRVIRRECATGCKYLRGEWSANCTSDGKRVRLDNLIGPKGSSCQLERKVTRDCKRACHYLKSDWSECLNGFKRRKLTLDESKLTGSSHQNASNITTNACPKTKLISRSCSTIGTRKDRRRTKQRQRNKSKLNPKKQHINNNNNTSITRDNLNSTQVPVSNISDISAKYLATELNGIEERETNSLATDMTQDHNGQVFSSRKKKLDTGTSKVDNKKESKRL